MEFKGHFVFTACACIDDKNSDVDDKIRLLNSHCFTVRLKVLGHNIPQGLTVIPLNLTVKMLQIFNQSTEVFHPK